MLQYALASARSILRNLNLDCHRLAVRKWCKNTFQIVDSSHQVFLKIIYLTIFTLVHVDKNAESVLHPKIEPVRPRSARFVYGTAPRFGKMPCVECGKDSPGPNAYKIGGIFDNKDRHRSPQYSTFGASERASPTSKDSPGKYLKQNNELSKPLNHDRSRPSRLK